jgi:integrase
MSGAIRSVSFSRFQAEVLALYQPPCRRPATRAKVRQVLGELAPYCRSTRQLEPAAISQWMADHPDRSASTHRSLLSSLRAACSYGEFRGYLRNPFEYRGLAAWVPADELEDGEEFRRHRSAAEVVALLRQADSEALGGGWDALRLRAVVYTAAYTGAGTREIMGLRTADVEMDKGIIRFKSHVRRRLKTGARAAILGIPSQLGDVLDPWMPLTRCEWLFPHKYFTGPWLNGSVGKKPLDQLKALGERAGVTGMTFLALRHTVGTLAEAWGLSELELQSQLRHARRQTQRHYRHADIDLRRATAAKIRYES